MEHWLEASWYCDDQRVGAKHISDILAKGHTIFAHGGAAADYHCRSSTNRYVELKNWGENIVDDGFQFITAHKVTMFLAMPQQFSSPLAGPAGLSAKLCLPIAPLGNFDWLRTAMLVCGRKIAVTLVDICNCFRPWIMTQAWNQAAPVHSVAGVQQAEHLHSKITLRWQFTIPPTLRQ